MKNEKQKRKTFPKMTKKCQKWTPKKLHFFKSFKIAGFFEAGPGKMKNGNEKVTNCSSAKMKNEK